MLVGNGLLFDFLNAHGFSIDDWHPAKPSTWRSQPTIPVGLTVARAFPRFTAFARSHRKNAPNATDFDIFDALLKRSRPAFPGVLGRNDKRYREWFDDAAMEVEARHFLVAMFSYMQTMVVRRQHNARWAWAQWLADYGQEIGAVTSFNYDLLIEDALYGLGLSFRRTGLPERGTIEIHKPHGSIDFLGRGWMVEGGPTYPLRNLFSRNDTPIDRAGDLSVARLDAEIVLPSEASAIKNFQWVSSGATAWKNRCQSVEALVIAGLSYWHCDQAELDDLVDSVPTSATVYMCNPSPSAVWLEKLRNRFGAEKVITVHAGPPSWSLFG